jgi:hypothetical protein
MSRVHSRDDNAAKDISHGPPASLREFPATRIRKNSSNIASAMCLAVAVLAPICAAIAATAANIRPEAAHDSPSAIDPRRGKPKAHQSACGDGGQEQVGDGRYDQRSRPRRVPAHHRRTKNFALSRLFFGPRVADYDEQARYRGREHAHRAGPPCSESADGRRVHGSQHRDHGRLAHAFVGEGAQRIGARVEPREARCDAHREDASAQPDQDRDPVAAQGEANQRAGAGYRILPF